MSVILKCKHCGECFKVAPAFAKRGKKYCSNACRIADGYQTKYATNDMYEFLCKNASSHTIKELVEMLEKELAVCIEKKQLAQYCIKMHIQYKYEKPKKSHSNIPTKNGTLAIKTDGDYIKVKTNKNKWEYLQRVIYQNAYNVKLPEDVYVIFLDQDRRNFNVKNLKAITRRSSAIMSKDGLFSIEPKITKLGHLSSKLNIKAKENRQ